jgi:amphi-Trp domain-containing protein
VRTGTTASGRRTPLAGAREALSVGVVELLEIEQKQTLQREEVAKRLHALADALARHNDVEFDRGGMHFKLKVPDEVRVKVELEVEDDGVELEIELHW